MARPPSTFYRFQKMARRNKTVFAASAAVAAALVIGFIACLYLFMQERDARRRAVAAEKEQARLREKAEAVAMLEAEMRRNAELGEKYSRAGLLLSKGQYDDAEKIVAELPPNPTASPFYNAFTVVHAQRGEWGLALTNCVLLDKFCAASNSPMRETAPSVYHALAPLLVQTGDLTGYTKLRQRIIKEFADTSDPVIAERLGKDCLMLPPEAAQLEALAKMADMAISAGPTHKVWPYFEFVKGLSEFRHARYTEAIGWLQKVVTQTEDRKRTVEAYMTLAMAQQGLGQSDDARKSLADGLALSKASLTPPARGSADEAWNDWIIAHVLAREATHLITPTTEGGSDRK